MNSTIQFINDMKDCYGMNDLSILQAIQDDPQHEFIMDTQDVNAVKPGKSCVKLKSI